MESFDLQAIAVRCGLPIRIVRYVLDYSILPGTPYVKKSDERGKPRTLTCLEAFSVAIAAHLLNAGIKRANIATAMAEIVSMKGVLQEGVGDDPLETILAMSKRSILCIDGHGRIASVSLGDASLSGPAYRGKGASNHGKIVAIEVNLASIRDRLFPAFKKSHKAKS